MRYKGTVLNLFHHFSNCWSPVLLVEKITEPLSGWPPAPALGQMTAIGKHQLEATGTDHNCPQSLTGALSTSASTMSPYFLLSGKKQRVIFRYGRNLLPTNN